MSYCQLNNKPENCKKIVQVLSLNRRRRSEWLRRSFDHFAYLLNFLLAVLLVTTTALADNAFNHELDGILTKLSDPNPTVVSENAKKLSNFPFREAEASLIGLIRGQISRGSDGLNTYILAAALEALNSIGTDKAALELAQLKSDFEQLPVTDRLKQPSKVRISENIITSINLTQDRKNPLPLGLSIQIPKNSPIVEKDGIRHLTVNGKEHKFFNDQVSRLARQGDEAAKTLLSVTSEFLTDSVLTNIATNTAFKIIGRDIEAKEALSILLRMKGKNPIFVGPAGAGKTTIAQRLAQVIATELSDLDLYAELRGATILETTPAQISRLAKSDSSSAQASAIEDFFNSVLAMEKKTERPVIVFIDEIHTLSEAQIEAMKPYLDSSSRGVRLVGATTGKEFNMAFKQNEAIKRRLHTIAVTEFSIEKTIEVVKQTWQGQIENHYGVQFTERAVKNIVQSSQVLLPDNGRFDAAIKVMQDLAISERETRQSNKNQNIQIDETQVSAFLQSRLGYPVNPRDGKAMKKYRLELENKLNEDVLFQTGMVESTLDLWMELMGDAERGVRVQALLGPTGTGKSELGRSLAKHVFSNEGAFFEIDANTYKTGGLAVNSLLGAPNGVVSSDKTSGVLLDYLDDPARGKFGGIILINEAERMPPQVWERIMEMLDTGEVTGGDGKVRRLKRHLIIFTSNRTDKIIFPPGIEKLNQEEMTKHIASFDNDKLREAYKQKSSGRDEFVLPEPIIARVDRWSLARPITLDMAKAIAHKIAAKTLEKLSQRFELKITADSSVADAITERSYQYGMGARPVIKAVQSFLQKIVGSAVAEMSEHSGQTLSISVEANHLKAKLNALQANAHESTLALPKAPSLDPLDDPAFAQKMKNLLPSLREKIIGQEDAIKAIAQSVIAKISDPSASKRPTALFLVGSTGTGKTSIAKALAKALYNNADRAEVIDLGKVNFEGALNDIFGSKKGYVGSLDPSQFEEILNRNPEGGVIVFDEASNMGGDSKQLKNALFKQGFYSLLEEGIWTSSATNRTFDLSKYVFIFTGNDGERLFAGVDSDDLRLTTYQENKERSKVQKILLEAGVPEAFLGRMANVILMKPLLSTEIKKIAEVMLKETLKSYEERGMKFEIAPDFYDKLARAFYSHDQGARSIRSMFDSGFKSTLANLIIQGGGLKALIGQSIHIGLTDTLSSQPYLKSTEARKVELTLEAKSLSGQVVETITEDLTTSAIKVNKPTLKDALGIAVHEAGHAIVNNPELTGQKLAYLTIIGTGNMGGYARYEEAQVKSQAFTRTKLVAIVAKMLAGARAQQLYGQPQDAGWKQDLKQANELISKSVLEYGLGPAELHGVLMTEGKPQLSPKQMQILYQTVSEIYQEADLFAVKTLRDNWQLLRDVSAALIKKGSMTGDEFSELRSHSLASHTGIKRQPPSQLRCDMVF